MSNITNNNAIQNYCSDLDKFNDQIVLAKKLLIEIFNDSKKYPDVEDYLFDDGQNIVSIHLNNANNILEKCTEKCPDLFVDSNIIFKTHLKEIFFYYNKILSSIGTGGFALTLDNSFGNLKSSLDACINDYFLFVTNNYKKFVLNLLEFDKFESDRRKYLDGFEKQLIALNENILEKTDELEKLKNDQKNLIEKVNDGSKQKIIEQMANFFDYQAKNYRANSEGWKFAFIGLSVAYLIFQGLVIIKHIPGDVNDFIIKFSVLPLYLFLSAFLIGQFNKSKNLFDEYKHKWVAVNSMSTMVSDDKLVPGESLLIYYNTLFQAINRSPVEMLISKKNVEHDDENYMKLLTLLLASGKKSS